MKHAPTRGKIFMLSRLFCLRKSEKKSRLDQEPTANFSFSYYNFSFFMILLIRHA